MFLTLHRDPQHISWLTSKILFEHWAEQRPVHTLKCVSLSPRGGAVIMDHILHSTSDGRKIKKGFHGFLSSFTVAASSTLLFAGPVLLFEGGQQSFVSFWHNPADRQETTEEQTCCCSCWLDPPYSRTSSGRAAHSNKHSIYQSEFPLIQTIASVSVSRGVGPFLVSVRGNPQFWFRVPRKMRTE